MSCFGLKKPSHPAKKAWCRLATALQTKLHKLRRSKPVAAILPTPRRPPHHIRRRNGRLHARKLNHHQSFAPVFVDELFSRPVSVHVEPAQEVDGDKVTLKTTKEMDERIVDVGSSSSTTFSLGAPSSSSRATGELSEVDMRAEMFIARFKEEMRLQRQRSFGEYQEMLARGI